MPPVILQISSMLLLLLLPVSGSGVELGTRQQTIIPLNIPPGTPELAPSNVSQSGVVINFLGELLSADALSGPWNDVTTNSPYAVSAANGTKFYRAAE
jgi:hypothetical protein